MKHIILAQWAGLFNCASLKQKQTAIMGVWLISVNWEYRLRGGGQMLVKDAQHVSGLNKDYLEEAHAFSEGIQLLWVIV